MLATQEMSKSHHTGFTYFASSSTSSTCCDVASMQLACPSSLGRGCHKAWCRAERLGDKCMLRCLEPPALLQRSTRAVQSPIRGCCISSAWRISSAKLRPLGSAAARSSHEPNTEHSKNIEHHDDNQAAKHNKTIATLKPQLGVWYGASDCCLQSCHPKLQNQRSVKREVCRCNSIVPSFLHGKGVEVAYLRGSAKQGGHGKSGNMAWDVRRK